MAPLSLNIDCQATAIPKPTPAAQAAARCQVATRDGRHGTVRRGLACLFACGVRRRGAAPNADTRRTTCFDLCAVATRREPGCA